MPSLPPACRSLLPGLLLGLLFTGLPPAAAAAPSAWLLGERHDHEDHQRQAAAEVRRLAAAGRLQAVVLEMAERGRATTGLPAEAGEAEVRRALAWNEQAWPWARYREVVMQAVRAGRPVLGGNLPRHQLRDAMLQARWDHAVPAAAQDRLREAVRDGHCGLLPEAQLQPMVRMQLARDRSLAEALAQAAAGGEADAVVLMLSGSVHASRETGVPLQLPAVAPGLRVRSIAFTSNEDEAAAATAGFDERRPALPAPPVDHCAALKQRGMPAPASAPAASS